MQSTASVTVAAPLHARPRSVCATSAPGHLAPIVWLCLVSAFAMALVTTGSTAQSAGLPVPARLSRHLACALYRASKYFRAAFAMPSWHFWAGVCAPSATDAAMQRLATIPALMIDVMDVPPVLLT